MEKLTYYNKPILFCIFNRIDCTQKSFECIRRVKPRKLYIASDGPRESIQNEKLKVKEVIDYVESHIDWECEVHKNYSNKNLGCRERISSAISWALSFEEDIVIMEDDIIPNMDFYTFCSEMLDYYKDDDRVMMISGTNFVRSYKIKEQYCFSAFSSIWGWATWKRAWKYYDNTMSDWPQIKKSKLLNYLAPWPSRLFYYWNYKYVYNHELNSWAYVWSYARHKRHGLGIVPRENLVLNCGFESEQSTHNIGKTNHDFTYGFYSFPLEKNTNVVRNVEYDKNYINIEYSRGKALWVLFKKTILFIPRKLINIFR